MTPPTNLFDPKVREAVEYLVTSGKVLVVGMAPPCCSFSAVTPAVRSLRFRFGVPWLQGRMKEKVRQGNSHAAWCRKVIDLCEAAGVVWWLENPDTSGSAPSSCIGSLMPRRSGAVTFAILGLLGGSARIATNCELAGMRHFCRCAEPHLVLRGRSSLHKKTWTAVAQPYPRGFAEALASAAAREVKWQTCRVPGCAGSSGFRIGEAANLGPCSSSGRFGVQADAVCSHAALRGAALGRLPFLVPVLSRLSSVSLLSLPSLSCHGPPRLRQRALLRWEVERLSSHDHRCAKADPGCRPYLQVAWELVNRWELVEPPISTVAQGFVASCERHADSWKRSRW